MSTNPVLAFHLNRSDDVIGAAGITSTRERIHGLLRVEEDRLVVQWRAARETDLVGEEIRTERELDPVRELVVPLSGVAGAAVRWRGWRWLRWGTRLELTAADLRAFEDVAGEAGLKLAHPAILTLPVAAGDRLAAQEFAADLNLVLAERALPGPSPHLPLPPAGQREEQG